MTACNEVHPPLYFLLSHFWMSICSDEWFLRMSSVVFSILSVYATWLTALEIYDKKTACIASCIIAFSSFDRSLAQEFRMYSLLEFLYIFSFLIFIKYLKSFKSKHLIILTILNSAGLYTHYLFVFAVLTQTIIFTLKKSGDIKRYLIHIACVFTAFLPWVVYFLKNTKMQDFSLREAPGFSQLTVLIQQIIFGPFIDIPSLQATLICISALLLILAAAKSSKDINLAAGIPLFCIFIISSLTSLRIFEFKYFVVIVPFVSLMLANTIRRNPHKTLSAVIVSSILLLNLISIKNDCFEEKFLGQNWREAGNILNNNTNENDLILVNPSMMSAPVYYYYGGRAQIRPADKAERSFIKEFSQYNRLLLVTTPNHPYAIQTGLKIWMDNYYIKQKEYETGTDSYSKSNIIEIILYEQ